MYVPPGSDVAALRVRVARVSHLTTSPRAGVDVGTTRCGNHVDAVCRPSLASADARNSIAKYLFTSAGDTYYCSGTLLNDLDPATQIPWFLTADHCVQDEAEAASMEFYWFFEAEACGAGGHDLVRTTGGATLLVSDPYPEEGTDGALLRLNGSPPAGAGLAGWSAGAVSPGEQVVTLHHPSGALKKLSTGVVVGYSRWRGAGPAKHIEVVQREPTEGGSSGSSLWKRVDGADRVVGMLTGGSRGCTAVTDHFGRFDLFYPRITSRLGGTAAGVATDGVPIRSVALLDAATGSEVVGLDASPATVDLGVAGTASFDIVARTGAGAPGSMRLELAGPVSAARTSGRAPHRLFGRGAGTGLPPGRYTVAATAYAGPDGTGRDWPAVRGAFAVTGTTPAPGRTVASVAVVDEAGRVVGAAESGAVAARHVVGSFGLRARTAGDAGIGSVVFAVRGAATLSHTSSTTPFAMPATLAAGAYAVTATPYAGPDGTGAAGAALTVERLTLSQAPTPVTGFALVDARGGAPDPDVGPVADGAVLDVSAYRGGASIRADVGDADVARMVLELAGRRTLARTELAGGPFTLFGDSSGDYWTAWLPDGAYTLTATPYSGAHADAPVMPARTVSFTVSGSDAAQRMTGFTLVDARGGAPDVDVRAIADGAVLDVSAYRGEANIRADGADGAHVGSVVLALTGPRELTRTEDAGGPYALFGDSSGDYHGGWLPNGAYTLAATPHTERGGRGTALPGRTVSFTVAGGDDPQPVTGFTLVDARGGAPDPDVGALTDGAVVDVSAYGGEVSIRADGADGADGAHVGSVVMALTGPRDMSRPENAGGPYALFGDSSGDYQAGWLPNGAYSLAATPYTEADGAGDALAARTVSFTVTGGDDPQAVTGFTLVDARGGAPDPDVGPLEDGAVVDVSPYGGEVSIRADGADGAHVGSVVLALTGPRELKRTEDAGSPYALFGESSGDYRAGRLPDGAYSLTATPYTEGDGRGAALAARAVSFTVTGARAVATVTGFTLVDARGGAPDPDVGPIADGAVLDVSAYDGEVSVRADGADGAHVGSVVLALTGRRVLTRTEDAGGPYALFGASSGDYQAGWLPDGAYTLTATSYSEGGAGGSALVASTASFTVTGTDDAQRATGFTLVDARGGAPDPDVGAITDGAVLDVSAYGGEVNIRADGADGAHVDSVVLALTGTRDVTRRENAGGPYALFGDSSGDYHTGWLPNGAYSLTATSHAERDGRAAALAARTVAFTVAGTDDAPAVTGFALVDARGGAPDPDVGRIADGAVLDVSAYSGEVNIRADGADGAHVGSVVLALTGARNLTRTEDTRGPYSLFGDVGGDYRAGWLPNGAYTLTATPYTAGDGRGAALPARTVSFTVTGGDDPRAVTGFTLVDARGGAPDPDVGPFEDGAVLDVSAYGGEVNIRADGAHGAHVGSVVLALTGAREVTRAEDAGGPYSLFGDDEGNYHSGWLPNGAYTLTATPYQESRGRGTALPARTVSFTLAGMADAPAVTGFTLVDARGGAPDPDVGPIEDGAVLDVSAYGGDVSIRADGADGPHVGSVVLALTGARKLTRAENADGPYTLFGDGARDYHSGWLPDGAYTLTATAYTERYSNGAAMSARTVSFTVAGGDDALPVTGFTLVDARGGAPDPDVGTIEDGAVLDVSAYGGKVNIRADGADVAHVGSVVLALTGARNLTRTEEAGGPYALFGDSSGDYYAGWLPDGAYALTATPFTERRSFGEALPARTVSFTVRGTNPEAVTELTLVNASGGPPDPDIGAIEPGATVRLAPAVAINVRAEVDARPIGSMRLTLRGAAYASRVVGAQPFTLFRQSGADHAGRVLPSGSYTLTAQPYAEPHATGEALTRTRVRFELEVDAARSPLTGFVLVDPTGGAPDPDLGALTDGATVDVGATGGAIAVRAETGSELGSVVFALDGPSGWRRLENSAPFAAFGERGGDYRPGWLVDGAYTLTATPYAAADGAGAALPALEASFTVSGADAADSAVTGFTLIDAAGPGPHPDLAAVADGGTLDLAGGGRAVNVRADVSPGAALGSVRFDLRGKRAATFVDATAAYALFGGGTDRVYAAGSLRNGAYTLTATPYADAAGAERMAGRPRTVSFAVTGSTAGPLEANIAAADGTVGEGTAAAFAVTLDRPAPPGGFALSVAVSETGEVLSGTAPTSVAFAAGATTATLEIATDDDRVAEGDGTVTATLLAGAGYVLGASASATVTVEDDDAAVWTAAFAPTETAEGGTAELAVSVANGATFAAEQTLVLTTSGTASTSDHDLPASLTLAAGASSARATLTVADDEEAEGAETLTVSVAHDGAAVASATLAIRPSDPPAATVAAASAAVAEGEPAVFEVSLDRAAPAGGLSVGLTVAVTGGVLAEPAPAAVAVAAGASRALLELPTADDAVAGLGGTVTATLVAGDGYTLGAAASATVSVSEDDVPEWTVSVDPASVEEGGRATVTVSIGNGVAHADRTVTLAVSGLESSDYALSASEAVLAAGASSASATFEALEDGEEEEPETATVTASVDGAAVGAATLAVRDAGPGPEVTGVPQEGAELTAVVDGLSADEPAVYGWLRDGEAVPGATDSTHELAAADVGARLSVQVERLGRTRTSAPTTPVWAAPWNAPLGADEEELLGAELTLGHARTLATTLAGYARLPTREFGVLSPSSLRLGSAHEVDALFVRIRGDGGIVALATTPELPSSEEGLTVHWNGHRAGPLSATALSGGLRGWTARTAQPKTELSWLMDASSAGLRVAVSVRPAAAGGVAVGGGDVGGGGRGGGVRGGAGPAGGGRRGGGGRGDGAGRRARRHAAVDGGGGGGRDRRDADRGDGGRRGDPGRRRGDGRAAGRRGVPARRDQLGDGRGGGERRRGVVGVAGAGGARRGRGGVADGVGGQRRDVRGGPDARSGGVGHGVGVGLRAAGNAAPGGGRGLGGGGAPGALGRRGHGGGGDGDGDGVAGRRGAGAPRRRRSRRTNGRRRRTRRWRRWRCPVRTSASIRRRRRTQRRWTTRWSRRR